MPFNAQTRAGGFDAFFAATLHTDDNNVILIENVLLLIIFLVPKLDDNEIMLLPEVSLMLYHQMVIFLNLLCFSILL